ncbi:MAG: alkane 1-monooxygenase [Algoriphagus sp.]|uniref:alkane 1-monooxygenase n=1 Tax=Algoriphagus sp. TaxID=1872435 RepID=UPI0017E0B38B|nr:alkane 1-monooxygenase [Algoriphagus sp.]NVJ87337.1 alkane 1-monooxygenase [Algoriphagus sp.]
MGVLKKIGFFSALILPILLISGYYLGGFNRWLIHIFVFVLVPLMDYLISTDTTNIPKEAVSKVAKERFYQWVTFSWVYIQLAVLGWAFYVVATDNLSIVDWLSLTTGMALVTGGIGITVAHELGHKSGKLEQLYAKILLMTVCYMHFIIEHNRGHHVRVATPEDPATSRFEENFYAFWLRSVCDGYRSAWKIERERLQKKKLRFYSVHNEMIQYTLIPILFIALVFIGFSMALDRWVWEVPVFFFGQSILAFSLLEAVNYLEHYGMERKLLENGRYERVTPIHSWNASHRVSNFLLFQLQRHSDHHAFAHKPYQILNHYDESPQLPAGYSAMIIVAFFPPIWFSMMNPRLIQWKEKTFEGSVQ